MSEPSKGAVPSAHAPRGRWGIHLGWAVIGGFLVATLIAIVLYSIGWVSPWEADVLVKEFRKSLLYFYSSVLGASASILALMLAALSISTQSKKALSAFHYRRLRAIARLDTAVLIASLIIFMFIGLPFDRFHSLPRQSMTWVFYGMVTATAMTTGTMVTVVLALYQAVSETLSVIGLGETHHHLLLGSEEATDDTEGESQSPRVVEGSES